MAYFNSRPSARGDVVLQAHFRVAVRFQFTPLREGRHSPTCSLYQIRYFNSRPSARGDAKGGNYHWQTRFLNSRPSGWGYYISLIWENTQNNFNSRPSARGDATPKTQHFSNTFQFTPLREGRRTAKTGIRYTPYFNSRPSARGDHECRQILVNHAISIHAPPRGATAKDMQFLQIFCSTLTNQHGLTIVPRNLSRLFW